MTDKAAIMQTANSKQQTANSKQQTALLLRLKAKLKSIPFIYYSVHYLKSRYLIKIKWNLIKLFTRFNCNGLNKIEKRDKKIIVSLTSYPARINFVPYVIASLLRQTMKPDKIILWLADEQFPNRKLPKIFDKLKACGVDIKFCEDLRSHKKYFFTMKEFPEDIIITFDDDVIYNNDVIETLYKSYVNHPDCVSGIRCWTMKFSPDLTVSGGKCYQSDVGHESHKFKATGIGGIIYPPHSLHEELFNIEAMKNLCFSGDDLWLKFMEVMKGTKVVPVRNTDIPGNVPGFDIPGSQESALWHYNDVQKGNEIQCKKFLKVYNDWTVPATGKTISEIINEGE